MEQTTELPSSPPAPPAEGTANMQRFFIALLGLAVLFYLLWLGFDFLKTTTAPQIVIALFAVVWGVGGVALLFTLANVLVESLSNKWRDRIQPYVFVGPAVFFLGVFLFVPCKLSGKAFSTRVPPTLSVSITFLPFSPTG
jgi:alpha-glucoside transport system permease protein